VSSKRSDLLTFNDLSSRRFEGVSSRTFSTTYSHGRNQNGKSRSNGEATRAIATAQSLSSFVKSICDIMRRSNCASALQYVPELTWILFLRILDAQEERAREEAEAIGTPFTEIGKPLVRPVRLQQV
jgi:type I restriction enzyme M protein